MLTQGILQNLEEYFSDLDARTGKAVFFYRINGWNEEIGVFLKKYYEAARQTGVVLDGKIPNPDTISTLFPYTTLFRSDIVILS